ncbi:MAG: K(+)-transporting ATPase subunit F [Hyphomicrobiales bacterium]|nr:K(+)-transporting ATPase subunit F [Hyphomicrobiales bacterium]
MDAFESTTMVEPLLGLAVALALGIYLLITLIRPERF